MTNLFPRAYRGLPREAYILFFARMVNSLGNFVRPLLTLLLTDRLGLGQAQTGVIVTIASLTYIPGALLSGKLTDRFGRKVVLSTFWMLGVVTLFSCAFLGTSPIVIVLLILNAFFAGAGWPALTAMVTDLTTKETRPRVFSLLYLGNNIGFAVGPALAGLLYQHHLAWIFLGDGVTTLVALALIMMYVRETRPEIRQAQDAASGSDTELAGSGSTAKELLRRPALIFFAFAIAMFQFVYVQHGFSLPLQMRELFGVDGPRLFGMLMSANGLTVILLTALVTRVTARFSPIENTRLGGVFYAVGFGMIYFIHGFGWFVLSTVIWTVGEILCATNGKAYIANNTPISHRGRFAAATDVIVQIGDITGPLLMGGLIGGAGTRIVWVIGFGLAICGVLLLSALAVLQKRAPSTATISQ